MLTRCSRAVSKRPRGRVNAPPTGALIMALGGWQGSPASWAGAVGVEGQAVGAASSFRQTAALRAAAGAQITNQEPADATGAPEGEHDETPQRETSPRTGTEGAKGDATASQIDQQRRHDD